MFTLIDGKAQAAALRARLALAVKVAPVRPGLATLLVGDDPASAVYVQSKIKACEEIGINGQLIHLPADVSAAALSAEIARLNDDPTVHGILLQLPLPRPLEGSTFIGQIKPEKDVDGLGPVNYGLLAAGLPAQVPCTPLGCLHLIKSVTPDLAGLEAVVLGRSRLVGRPMAELLLQQNCTVTLAHSQSRNLPEITRRADILVVSVGQPGLVRADWVKPGAIVIDVGITRQEGKLHGDVAFDEVAPLTRAITPVPGGVGPMTVAMLMANTVRAAYLSAGEAFVP